MSMFYLSEWSMYSLYDFLLRFQWACSGLAYELQTWILLQIIFISMLCWLYGGGVGWRSLQVLLLLAEFQGAVCKSSKFLLCPYRPFPIWDWSGCLESIVLQLEKRSDLCHTNLAVCILDHFKNTQIFMVAAGCNLLWLQKINLLSYLTKLY